MALYASGVVTSRSGSPVHKVMSLSEMTSRVVPPYTMAPIVPLPITIASSKYFAGRL